MKWHMLSSRVSTALPRKLNRSPKLGRLLTKVPKMASTTTQTPTFPKLLAFRMIKKHHYKDCNSVLRRETEINIARSCL